MRKREMEAGIHRDLGERMSYSGYLRLDQILSAQRVPLGRILVNLAVEWIVMGRDDGHSLWSGAYAQR